MDAIQQKVLKIEQLYKTKSVQQNKVIRKLPQKLTLIQKAKNEFFFLSIFDLIVACIFVF